MLGSSEDQFGVLVDLTILKSESLVALVEEGSLRGLEFTDQGATSPFNKWS